VTPALWGRIDVGDYEHHPHHEKSGEWAEDCKPEPCAPSYDQAPQQPQEHHQQQQQQQQQQQPQPQPQQQQQQQQAPQSGTTPTHEERQKHWYDLDDQRKQQLEVYFPSNKLICTLTFFIRSEEASWPVRVSLLLAIMPTKSTERVKKRYIQLSLSLPRPEILFL
jgi:hypothetical protein